MMPVDTEAVGADRAAKVKRPLFLWLSAGYWIMIGLAGLAPLALVIPHVDWAEPYVVVFIGGGRAGQSSRPRRCRRIAALPPICHTAVGQRVCSVYGIAPVVRHFAAELGDVPVRSGRRVDRDDRLCRVTQTERHSDVSSRHPVVSREDARCVIV